MSSAHHASGLGAARAGRPAPQSRKTKSPIANELLVRILIGLVLAAIGIAVTLAGGSLFAGFVALASIAAAREWHRMVGHERYAREWIATGSALTAAIVVTTISTSVIGPIAILVAGATLAAGFGAARGAPVKWAGLGALYIGIPACALVALREHVHHGEWIVLGVLLVIWSADTGALATGRIFRGPKLIPSLSPSKTWSGLIGGLIIPAGLAAAYVAAFSGSPVRGFVVGFVLAAVGHGGDLFESWIKRRVGRKDSGESIPGHGGVLDRLDSTLFVAPLAFILVFTVGVSQLFGVSA
ncbi:MAG TPA: phosphatidate cytidylyltransferase [Rhizomicrobium sp.]|nr:phosphatidate cytidylyltransferase [Rhizomicrobium sp.]